jgi:hypothetical protein
MCSHLRSACRWRICWRDCPNRSCDGPSQYEGPVRCVDGWYSHYQRRICLLTSVGPRGTVAAGQHRGVVSATSRNFGISQQQGQVCRDERSDDDLKLRPKGQCGERLTPRRAGFACVRVLRLSTNAALSHSCGRRCDCLLRVPSLRRGATPLGVCRLGVRRSKLVIGSRECRVAARKLAIGRRITD